jgi:hypothetical protein
MAFTLDSGSVLIDQKGHIIAIPYQKPFVDGGTLTWSLSMTFGIKGNSLRVFVVHSQSLALFRYGKEAQAGLQLSFPSFRPGQ